MERLAIASYTDGRAGAIPEGDLVLAAELKRTGCMVTQTVWSDEKTDWRAFDAVVIRSCWDYHLRPDAFLAWIARLESLGIATVNSPAVIRWNAN